MNELILVVDDEPKIVRLARDYLERSAFRVITAADGNQALWLTRREKPDLVVLDLMLPGMDGFDVCRTIRQESAVPIIMLTARAEESDQLIGLELGADDYIVKPFSPKALVARVRAVLRRVKAGPRGTGQLRLADLLIDLNAHRVYLAGEAVHLTPNEFTLLTALAQQPGRVFTREQLLTRLHGYSDTREDRSIDSHIKNLRRKLEDDPSEPEMLLTVYGVGYRFNDEA